MPDHKPNYLLLCESKPVVFDDPAALDESAKAAAPRHGAWKFTLEPLEGGERLEAGDVERAGANRLALLAVVRGLESLDQPSSVRLLTQSDYVGRGLRRHLSDWRDNGFRWEHYENLAPVKNHDLWRRIDQALKFHEVQCRVWRVDQPHQAGGAQPVPAPHFRGKSRRNRFVLSRSRKNIAALAEEVSQA